MNTETQKVDVPADMRPVTKAEFWNAVKVTNQNVHPNPEKFETHWMVVGTRIRWGWTSRGFAGPFDYEDAPEEVFALASVGGAA